MKNSKKNTSIANIPLQKKTSLFDSIVENEKLQANELECQKLANRVGLIRKILVNRNLDVLLLDFDCKINGLVKEVAAFIDNELYTSKED